MFGRNTNTGYESLTYKVQEAGDLSITLYCAKVVATGAEYVSPLLSAENGDFGVKVFVSQDNIDWTEITLKADQGEDTGASVLGDLTWSAWLCKNEHPLPEGTQFVRFVHGYPVAWAQFFGAVTISAP